MCMYVCCRVSLEQPAGDEGDPYTNLHLSELVAPGSIYDFMWGGLGSGGGGGVAKKKTVPHKVYNHNNYIEP